MTRRNEGMNRAEKGWETRYLNEIAILKQQIDTMQNELYDQFLAFINKLSKHQDLARELDRMQKELAHFHRKHNRGSSSE
jgi:hypothetical protein